MVNETEGIGKSISLRWLIERTCTREMISWPRKQEISRARDIERTSLDSSGGEKLHQESRERNCSRYFNDILKIQHIGSKSRGKFDRFRIPCRFEEMPKWKMASSTDTSVSFYPLELLVEIPRVPKDASRGSEKKRGNINY